MTELSELHRPAPGLQRRYVDVGGGQVHFAEVNREVGGTPLVLLHQSASSWLGYLDLIASLGDAYWIVAPDTPGFGGSDPLSGEVTIPRLGSALVESLRVLDIEQCWLYGHHTGATIAAWIAANHPKIVRRLILSGPPFLDDAQKSRMSGSVEQIVISESGAHLVALWERHLGLARGSTKEVAHRELTLYLSAYQPEKTYQAVLDFDFPSVLKEIKCPTYVMGGEYDTIRSGLLPTHDGLSDSESEVVPGVGIYIADQVPDLVANRIRSWFV